MRAITVRSCIQRASRTSSHWKAVTALRDGLRSSPIRSWRHCMVTTTTKWRSPFAIAAIASRQHLYKPNNFSSPTRKGAVGLYLGHSLQSQIAVTDWSKEDVFHVVFNVISTSIPNNTNTIAFQVNSTRERFPSCSLKYTISRRRTLIFQSIGLQKLLVRGYRKIISDG